MKNWTKKGAVAALSVALSLSLMACSAGQQTPEEVIQGAREKMEAVQSMSYEMTTDLQMSMAGQSIPMTMTGVADFIAEPMAMHMDMTMDMGALGSAGTQLYAQEQDGTYHLYTGIDDGSGKMSWTAQTLTDAGQLEQYDAQASMDLYLDNAASFQENGTETVENEEAVRYDGVISNDSLNEVLTATGMMDQLSGLGVDGATVGSMLTDLGDMPVSIWVGQESGMPVKCNVDLTTVMQSIMTKALESAGSGETVTMESVQISIVIRNINGVERIEIPQEALDSAA